MLSAVAELTLKLLPIMVLVAVLEALLPDTRGAPVAKAAFGLILVAILLSSILPSLETPISPSSGWAPSSGEGGWDRIMTGAADLMATMDRAAESLVGDNSASGEIQPVGAPTPALTSVPSGSEEDRDTEEGFTADDHSGVGHESMGCSGSNVPYFHSIQFP